MDWGLKDIIEALQEISKWIFGGQIPPVVASTLGWALFICIILFIVWVLLLLVSKIIDIVKEKLWPLFYHVDEKRRNLRRRRFAEHIDSEIRFLNRQEAWSDYRFAELEAEVEAEGQRRLFPFIPFIKRTHIGLRREKSLLKALINSEDRLILLEGEPGAGKSVALRHLTTLLAQQAAKSPNNKTVIPIYINLKELRRVSQYIDRAQICEFVLNSLNRANDRDVEEFLDVEFDQGMRDGTWLFLFDSFDEIPDVLSSTEADTTIREYANAISDFLHGMNRCRGVIASRQFRGPGAMGWPKFKVLQLSEARQLELIKNSGMDSDEENRFLGMLGVASHEIRGMVSNPMFLGLVCDHYKIGNQFPENPHSVFETYINSRFVHDEERVRRKFNLGVEHLRVLAERIAFCMAADPGLGLSTTRIAIRASLDRLNFTYHDFEDTLDALEFIKIARSDASSPGDSRPFTFAHRRFQEYFATSVVLREPGRVSARELLLNALWRETAVVVFQTQANSQLVPFFEEIREILRKMISSLKLIFPKIEEETDDSVFTIQSKKVPQPFPWPKNTIHILGLLQSGFGNQSTKLPTDIRKMTGQITLLGYIYGILLDKKWALEIAGCAPSSNLTWLLTKAFASNSPLLKDAAYRQVAYLGSIPSTIAKSIRLALVLLFLDNRLGREKNATYAHLSRLARPEHFLSAFRFLRVISLGDFLLAGVFLWIVIWCGYGQSLSVNFEGVLIFIIIAIMLWSNKMLRIFLYDTSPARAAFMIEIFGTYIRVFSIMSVFALAGIPFLNQLVITPPSEIFFPLILFSAICFVWAPFSIASVVHGQFLTPIWWPFMIAFPILHFFSDIKRIVNRLLAYFADKNLILIALSFLYSMISLLVVAVLITGIGVAITRNFILFSVIIYSTLGLITFYITKSSCFWARDEYFFRKCTRDNLELTTTEFIRYCLLVFWESEARNRYVKHVRTEGLLRANAEDIELLKWFCIFVEDFPRRLKRYSELFWTINNYRKTVLIIDVIRRAYFKEIYKQKKLAPLFSSRIGYRIVKLPDENNEFKDEVYLLLEQVSSVSLKK